MEETTANVGKEAVHAGRRIGRRQLLRTLAASSGVVAASALVPGKWSKPLVEAGLLPAHAQVTPAPTMTSTPTATPTGTQTPTATPTDTPTPTPVPCERPGTPTQESPDDNTEISQPNVTFVWSTVSVPEGCEGVSYGIEIQDVDPESQDWRQWDQLDGLAFPTQGFSFTVTGPYRWRAWASPTAGDGSPSDWWGFLYAQS